MRAEWIAAIAALASAAIAVGMLIPSIYMARANRHSARAAETSAETAREALEFALRLQWTLSRLDDQRYELANTGGRTAFDVRMAMSADDGVMKRQTAIHPGEVIRFQTAIPWDHADPIVHVTWHQEDHSDPEHTRRYPLPPT